MPSLIPIPRNEGGTRAVLEAMAGIAGLASFDVDIRLMAREVNDVGGVDALDSFLRSHWNYIFTPLPNLQDLKVPAILAQEYFQTGMMTGACAEAATIAAAIAAAGKRYLGWPILAIFVCAVRPPRSIYFEHVFATIQASDAAQPILARQFNVDPTAENADYTGWQIMSVAL